jgi:tyrosine-protein phosphatase YwqE
MKVIKRTNILVETKRRYVVSSRQVGEMIQCTHCLEQMISAQASADFFGASSRKIYRFIEREVIHFAETDTNQIYVCPTSVKAALDFQKKILLSK